MKNWSLWLSILLSLWLVPALQAADETDPSVLLGQPAPQLIGKQASVGSQQGGLLKLKMLIKELDFQRDAQGKLVEKEGKYIPKMVSNVVVLNFFSTTCIPCIKEIPTYNRIAEHFKGQAVKMIYVNVDTEVSDETLTRFIQQRGINLPMMLPNQRDAIKKYRVYSLPRLVIIDQNGKVAHIVKGFHDDLESSLTKMIQDLLQG